MEQGYVPEMKSVLYELDMEEKQRVLFGYPEPNRPYLVRNRTKLRPIQFRFRCFNLG